MRFPVIRQHDATDCGPAVLAMIAAFHGKRQSIARLREIAGTDRQGTNLAGLAAAAEQIGFTARPVRAQREALEQVPLPAVAHWCEANRKHFVVIYKVGKRHVTIGDPAKGLRKLTRDEFHQYWTNVLLLLTPTPRLRDVVTRKSSFSRLCSLLLPHRRLFLDALLAAVLMTILGLTSSFFIQALVDFVFVLGRQPALNWLGLGMLLVLGARVCFHGLRSYLLAHLSQRIDAEAVLGYHRHLLGLPLTFFITRRTGEILSRMNDAVKIRIAISATSLSVIVDSLLVASTAAIMLWLNWVHSAAASALMVGLSTLGLLWFGGERQRVAIARAILADAPILVLDEPTSHLGSQSELAVQSLIDRRRGRRTTIVISHRPLSCGPNLSTPGRRN